MNKKNIQGQKHGYWEGYHSNGQVQYRCNYINGECHGYWISYYDDGDIHYKCFLKTV